MFDSHLLYCKVDSLKRSVVNLSHLYFSWTVIFLKLVHVIRGFSSMNEMTKVQYFLTIQIHDWLNMIWKLAKDLNQPEFWPYGHLKVPKIENEASKNIVLSSFRPWTKIVGRHEQNSFFKLGSNLPLTPIWIGILIKGWNQPPSFEAPDLNFLTNFFFRYRNRMYQIIQIKFLSLLKNIGMPTTPALAVIKQLF